MDRYLTPRQAAQILDCSTQWVYELAKRKVLKTENFGNRKTRFIESSVLKYRDANQVPEIVPAR